MASIVPVEKKSLKERLAILDKVAASTNKKYGKTIAGRIGKNKEIMDKLEIKFIPTPSSDFNEAVGGGLPRSRMTIVTGDSDSGKTSFLLNTIADNMKCDTEFVAGWLESENSLEKNYLCKTFGIDPERFFYIPLDNSLGAEKTLDIVEGVLSTGAVDIFCINSLRCLVPQKEKEKSLTEATVAEQARMNAKLMRKFTPLVAEHDTAFCIVQHLTTEIGSMRRDPKILAGGEAIKYWSALTVDFRKRSMSDSEPISREEGMKIGVTVKKNHCIPSRNPYVKFDYYVVYGQGIEEIAPSIQKGIDAGILERHGAYLHWIVNGELKEKFNSKADFRNRMKAEPEMWEEYAAMLSGNYEQLSEEEVKAIKVEEAKVQKLKDAQDAILDAIEAEPAENVDKKKLKKVS